MSRFWTDLIATHRRCRRSYALNTSLNAPLSMHTPGPVSTMQQTHAIKHLLAHLFNNVKVAGQRMENGHTGIAWWRFWRQCSVLVWHIPWQLVLANRFWWRAKSR